MFALLQLNLFESVGDSLREGMRACIREDNKDGEAGVGPQRLFHSGGVLEGPEHVAPGVRAMYNT